METAKQARETKIFFLEQINQQGNLRVAETSLYDFVMESAEETTSPRGNERKLHIRETERQCSCWDTKVEDDFDPDCEKCYQGTEIVFKVWDWGPMGQRPRVLETCNTEEEAEDYIFQRVYEYDFMRDDQRDTEYFYSEYEAKQAVIERLCSSWNVSEDVVRSVLSKQERIREVRMQREEEKKAQAAKGKALDQERINRIAAEYATLIQRQEGETYKETAARLSKAIGERIQSAVFHQAVKIVRHKN